MVTNRGNEFLTQKVTTVLTDTKCRNASANGKAIIKLPDGHGLYLWVYEDGRKYWRFRYWLSGKEKSVSLGVYPEISLKEARRRRDIERDKLNQKLDPSQERKSEKLKIKADAENSFEAVARTWHKKQVHTWVKSHSDKVIRALELNVFPTLGKRPLAKIEAPELLAVLKKIEDRGAYDLAHRVLQISGAVFRFGIASGICSRDISADLRGALTPHKKEHQAAVQPEELPKLLQAIANYEEIGDRQTRLALQLMSHTFVRTVELIGAEWSEFNMDKKVWVVPAKRMKMKTEHIVPLSNQSLAILKELKPLAGDSKFVFPGRNPNKTISNNTMLFALYRLGYKNKMTGHGFRAVASTVLNETGFRPDVIERQLAHREPNAIRGAYNRAEYIKERHEMMQWWSDYIDSAAVGRSVIPFPKRHNS